jgi:hypothetical protein
LVLSGVCVSSENSGKFKIKSNGNGRTKSQTGFLCTTTPSVVHFLLVKWYQMDWIKGHMRDTRGRIAMSVLFLGIAIAFLIIAVNCFTPGDDAHSFKYASSLDRKPVYRSGIQHVYAHVRRFAGDMERGGDESEQQQLLPSSLQEQQHADAERRCGADMRRRRAQHVDGFRVDAERRNLDGGLYDVRGRRADQRLVRVDLRRQRFQSAVQPNLPAGIGTFRIPVRR